MTKINAGRTFSPGDISTLPKRKKLTESEFARKYGIICTAFVFLFAWSLMIWVIAARRTEIRVTQELSAEYAHEYEIAMDSFVANWELEHTPTEDEVFEETIQAEADCIARLIGPFTTKQMKQTIVWNVIARVDSPYYPSTVEGVVNQADQWMFYDRKNPVREDDVEIALEMLRMWHDGRYPRGFDSTLVYGAWSPNDYYLFDDWNKGFGTKIWRYEG